MVFLDKNSEYGGIMGAKKNNGILDQK